MVRVSTPLQELNHPLLIRRQIKLYVKRDDLTHPEMMGNKWRKLKYNLLEAKRLGLRKIVTLGGAFSNHIAATAAAGKIFDFQTIGIIRGEEIKATNNHTLKKAHKDGMQFRFVSRAAYRELRKNPAQILNAYPGCYFLPEGGTNELAIKGVAELVQEIETPFDWIVSPIGTGGTFCGLLAGTGNYCVYGVSVLKGDFIIKEIDSLRKQFGIQNSKCYLDLDHHFGGYAKSNQQLVDFMRWFKEKFAIQLDPIYTVKASFAVWKKIEEGFFDENTAIILLHTGGLQGISS